MSELLKEIQDYWTRRSSSYSDLVNDELKERDNDRFKNVILKNIKEHEKNIGHKIKKVLDIGTGPGFFAIMLSKEGYDVTAVDYTPAMLEKAANNAKIFGVNVDFRQMDAQDMDFDEGSFDLIVTRNLTWNLEKPDVAYKEWHRVLKNGGLMLNFDAGWYNYLFDDKAKKAFDDDHENVLRMDLTDYNDYDESAKMEEISKRLVLSSSTRPEIDIELMEKAGFEASVDKDIWRDVWNEEERINWNSTRMFMLKGIK